MLIKLLKLKFFFVWIFISFFLGLLISSLISNVFIENLKYLEEFYFGIISYVISLVFIKPYKYRFINAFFHELSHMIFAFISFSEIKKLIVDKNGNSQVHCSINQNLFKQFFHSHFTVLAPYFFAPLTVILIILYIVLIPSSGTFNLIDLLNLNSNIDWMKFFIGFTYAYHFITSISQISPKQTDFKTSGFIYGLSFVLVMKLLFMLLVITVVSAELNSVEFLEDKYMNLFESLQNNILEFTKSY